MNGIFGGVFAFFPIFFLIIFGLVVFVFVYVIAKGIRNQRRGTASPTLTVDAKIAARRMYVSSNSFTSYYVTFEVPSGDRMELELTGEDYGYLAEGDHGRLTFQGSRYKNFERV